MNDAWQALQMAGNNSSWGGVKFPVTLSHLSSLIISLLIVLSEPLLISFLTSSSLFWPFFKIQQNWSPISTPILGSFRVNLQCRIETTCEYSASISTLDCRLFMSPVCSPCLRGQGAGKVPFLLLLGSVGT